MGARRLTEDRDRTRAPAKERRGNPSERTLWGAQRRGLATTSPVTKAGVGGDASGARSNWATITASPEQPLSRTLAGQERSESSGEWGSSCQRAAASPRLRDLHRLLASSDRGTNKARVGLIVGQATQVVLGASLRVRGSLASRHKPPPVVLPTPSPQPAPPRVTQEAATNPPSIKDPPDGAAGQYWDVLSPSLWPACSPAEWDALRRSRGGAKKPRRTSGKGTSSQKPVPRKRMRKKKTDKSYQPEKRGRRRQDKGLVSLTRSWRASALWCPPSLY